MVSNCKAFVVLARVLVNFPRILAYDVSFESQLWGLFVWDRSHVILMGISRLGYTCIICALLFESFTRDLVFVLILRAAWSGLGEFIDVCIMRRLFVWNLQFGMCRLGASIRRLR